MSETAYQGYATGAVAHAPSESDYVVHKLSHVAAAMAAPLPAAATLAPLVEQLYDQGQIPACVCYSTALMKSLQAKIDRGRWQMFDALECYHANGGNDRQGVAPRGVLEMIKDEGMLALGGTARYRIGSYAFVKQDPQLFVATLKAAIVANQPCVVALRLPEVFGWDSSGAVTDAYHQMGFVGFDSEGGGNGNAICGNSWTEGWGNKGFCRVPFDYLTANNFQNGDCYAWTTIDAVDPALAPDPPALPLPEITVGGYLGATSSVPIVKAGAMLQIVGSGFLATDITVMWCGVPLDIIDREERLLTVRAPFANLATAAALLVFSGGRSVTGPLLVVVPASQ